MGTGSDAATSVRLEVLGPLRLTVGGAEVDVPGARRRAVLALLAMAEGRAVDVDAIIDAVWPEDPPDTGAQAVFSHISRLRRTLGPAADRLARVGRGYCLQLAAEDVDALEVRRAAGLVRERLHVDPVSAAQVAAAALVRWRGDALTEFCDVPPLAADAVRLAELRLSLGDDALEARLALGEDAVADATAAVAANPLRERTVTLLMRLLAADGRTAEAMEVAMAFRRRLVEETGTDPGPRFRLLEQEVAAGGLARIEAPSRTTAHTGAPAGTGAGAGAGAGAGTRAGTRAGARAGLAPPRGPMTGRDHDREELLRLLGQQHVVTVTGPGGVGKTRLVLDVAAELAGRGTETLLIPLAEVTEPARVPEAVASALGVLTGSDRSARPVLDAVAGALAGQSLLLVLDNCEHVVSACRELVSELGASAPDVRVLATSRVTLHAPAEYVMRLQPLPLPRAADPATDPSTGSRPEPGHLRDLSRQPAVRAFLEHAQRRVGEGLTLTAANAAVVTEVVRRLDGLPLAIELAASQLAVLPVEALHDRLGRALDVLATERPADQARHRTLRATIAWSYDLLGAEEQSLLRTLAPFPGGVDLDTVERLADISRAGSDPLVLLSRLVDASLVVVERQTAARYTLLDTVRAFLLDELDARGERDRAEQRFLRWAASTAQELRRARAGVQEPAADRRLRVELANLRAARDLARRRGDLETRVAMTCALHELAVYRDLSELWAWSRELAADASLAGHPLEVLVLGSAAEAAWLMGDTGEAERLARHGLEVAHGSGAPPELTVRSWNALGVVAMFAADFETSRGHWLRAAACTAAAATQLATAAMASGYAGDRETAEDLLARAREASERLPSVSDRAYNLYAAGEIAADPQQAVRSYTAARDLARSCGATFVEGVATVGLASVLTTTGDVAGAAGGFLMLLDYWPVTGNQTQLWTTLRNAALLLLDQDRVAAAALLLARADAADSASSVGGESGSRVASAWERLTRLLDPAELVAVRARAAALAVPDVLAAARRELGHLVDEHRGTVTPGARSRPGSGTGR